MTTRQFRVQTPVGSGPKEEVQWAMSELQVLVSAGAALDDVVTPGMVIAGAKGTANGALHIRRGWQDGLSVAVMARHGSSGSVLVTVIPTSRLQSAVLVLVFATWACAGVIGGYTLAVTGGLAGAGVGLFVGAFVGILAVAFVQRLGIGVTRDASAAADKLAADIGRWVEQRNRVE